MTNYVLSAFALSYLTLTVGMPRVEALIAVLVSSLLTAFAPVLGGVAVDRFGAKRVVMFGSVAGIVLTYPVFLSLQSGDPVLAALGMTALGVIAVGATAASTGTFLTNLFPTRYRFTGVATARELNGALVAGPTPLIATALVAAAGEGSGSWCCSSSPPASCRSSRWSPRRSGSAICSPRRRSVRR